MEQKLDAELSLSLSLSEEERMKDPVLRAGYEPATRIWTLILLYQGSLTEIQDNLSVSIIPLLGSFAIIRIPAEEIPTLLLYPQVLYLELPRPLYEDEITGISASCMAGAPFFPDGLTGQGTAVAVLDSGVDYRHPDFRTDSGSTRILTYWDQGLAYDRENRYGFGHIFSENALNALFDAPASSLRPSADSSGHGTHIAGICAGNGRGSGGRNRVAAPKASLLVVKLKNEADSVFTDYANLMMAVDYVVRFAADRALPLAINISYGSNDGPHDGSGLMERYLENCIFYGKNVVVIATGNEGISRRHSQLSVASGEEKTAAFSVAPGETSLYVQLWKHFGDRMSYRLSLPSGLREISIPGRPGIYRFEMGDSLIRLIISEPTPYQTLQEMFLAILPAEGKTVIDPGIWQFRIRSEQSVHGQINLWLPSREATNASTGFLDASPDGSLTVPSTARNVISVGGYDSMTDTFASFSGRGFAGTRNAKPDLAAPAVNILSAAPGGGYSIRSGTSMAAPFVTGASALLMEYGIIQGQDPFLYGEKIKALLQKGTRPLPAFSAYPNTSIGWGVLCLRDSLPE